MQKREEFGYICHDFSVALSANGVVMPGGKSRPLRKSLHPYLDITTSAGLYELKVEHNGKVVCLMPVTVVWVQHASEPEPFIGFQTPNPLELADALRVYERKSVSLTLSR